MTPKTALVRSGCFCASSAAGPRSMGVGVVRRESGRVEGLQRSFGPTNIQSYRQGQMYKQSQIQRRAFSVVRHPPQGRGYATPSAKLFMDSGPAHSAVHKIDGDHRERIVILGSGWAGYVLSRNLDPSKYRITVISPRSYFVFTPFLNDTAVGTLEFRNVLESVRKRKSKVEFLQGWADDVNFVDKTVTVEPSVLDPDVGHALTGPREPAPIQQVEGFEGKRLQLGGTGSAQVPTFPIKYDKLVIAVGCYSQTFGTKGVRENAMFLKDVGDARRIRRRVLELFELCRMPIIPEETKKHLLHFAIIGGGPTGMEFAACLSDLIRDDLSVMYPDLIKYIKITLYDVAPKVLPMFDASLADYAVKQYMRQNVQIKTSYHVEELRKGFPDDPESQADQGNQVKGRVYTLRTTEDGDVGIGMCVWSTGNMNNPFVSKALNHVRRYPTGSAEIVDGGVNDPMKREWVIQRDEKTGFILVDNHFRLQLKTQVQADEGDRPTDDNMSKAMMKDVFALGDTTIMKSGRLPGTAQVANQQALWLAKALNKHPEPKDYAAIKGFGFKNLGIMTYLGGAKAVLQTPTTRRDGTAQGIKGYLAYFIWRGAYLMMTLSWRNKFLIPVQWLGVKMFGRDVSRF